MFRLESKHTLRLSKEWFFKKASSFSQQIKLFCCSETHKVLFVQNYKILLHKKLFRCKKL